MRKQQPVVFIIILLLSACSGAPVKEKKTAPADTNIVRIVPKNYLNFKYSKVIAFATVSPYDYSELYFEKKMDLAKFHDTISKSLNKAEIKYLNDLLSGKYRKPYRKDSISIVAVADCFYPRHNIIFLNGNDLVNYVSICFECGNTKESKEDLAHMDDSRAFFNSVGLPVLENPNEYKACYDSLNKIQKSIPAP